MRRRRAARTAEPTPAELAETIDAEIRRLSDVFAAVEHVLAADIDEDAE